MQKINASLILVFVAFFCIVNAQVFAQQSKTSAAPFPAVSQKAVLNRIHQRYPSMPLSVPTTFPGTVPIGLEDMYQAQFANRGLHNIVIDPDHPQNIHAAITFAENVTEADTASGRGFLPQLSVYYIFSSDDGATWSVPKRIDTGRTSVPELILIKRGAENIPVISALRNISDTNTPYFCSLYIEQGSVGTGDFKEFRTDRKAFNDSLRNIDYPSIALSHDGTKIFMSAGIDNTDKFNPGYIQFGTYRLSEDKKSATWGGWKPGPNHGTPTTQDPIGFAYSFSTSIQVSASGKLGIVWINRDFHTPDISTYLSESTDEGASWLANPKVVMHPDSTPNPDVNTNKFYFLVGLNTDFWYAGETAECAIAGFYYNRDSSKGFYIPQSGSLLFWKDGLDTPVLIISKENDSQLGTSLLDGSWLAGWQNTGPIEPQGLTNLEFPTVARTSDPNIFSIYFSAWQDGDIEDVSSIGQIGNGQHTSYPYYSIYRTTTLDGGATFSGPDKVHANDPTNSNETQFDYRQIEVASWNPIVGNRMVIHSLFNVDSTAGVMDYGGNPGFDEVTWLFEKAQIATSGVATAIASGNAVTNYPNPFSAKTYFYFTLQQSEPVSIRIADLLGREVFHAEYGILEGGVQRVALDANTFESGAYPYMLTIGESKSHGVLQIVK